LSGDLPLAPEALAAFVRNALAEDLGDGDLTTNALVPEEATGIAVIRAKAFGTIAGGFVAEEVFRQAGARYVANRPDGTEVGAGDVVGRVKGPLRALLTGERTALNVLGRLSGIATHTRRFVEAVAGAGARILDTRKTLPGYRRLEKYAVRMGGGTNHRMDLADEVLVKENHVVAARAAGVASSFAGTLTRLIERIDPSVRIGVEVEDLSQFHIALEAKPAYILCDDFTLDDLTLAVRICADWPGEARPEIEASGGITLDNVAEIAATGVDRISVGALTHSAPAFDLSLVIE
jgi:nicotinate-nucleotide pyrophosphorylase (carboxylating)